jgi:hypothetical protein
MPESIAELQTRLINSVSAGFRERLLDRGLARGLIWQDGVLPPGSPPFQESLTEDLLDYAHGVLAIALRLRSLSVEADGLQRAFLVAGEAIEAAVHRGDISRIDRGFNRVSAAVAFHLARYAARSYSILPNINELGNLAPIEIALVHLLRRSLDEMHSNLITWATTETHSDEKVADRLMNDDDFDESDAINEVLTMSFVRGLALFDHAISTGTDESAQEAKRRLFLTADAAKDSNAVSHWWTSTLAAHLIDDLWRFSLFMQIPTLPPEQEDGPTWNILRSNYIHRLRITSRSAIELWPSQIPAAKRALNPIDDLVVALPTSAGKTRIAELCILRALASSHRVIYVTPLRALSAQVERDLGETFRPLGFHVSSLYGSAGIEAGDEEAFHEGNIVIATPEKIDFALRNDPTILDDVRLVVLDEGHMLGPNEREVRYEALVQRILRRSDSSTRRLVCLSALFPTPEEMTDLVEWIRQDEPGMPMHSSWRPTRQRFGVLSWANNVARLDVKVEEENPFVPRFIEPALPPAESRRKTSFPNNKNELTLAAAWKFIEQGKDVLIYCAIRGSVEVLGRLILKCIAHKVLKPLREENQRIKDAMLSGTEWLPNDHPAVQCLKYGIALHHGGLPRPFLSEIERLLRTGDCPLVIASPTLAQGLNLSASVLLVPSIWRKQEIIPEVELANVAGRAGRAFVDLEGLILHVVWEKSSRRTSWVIATWNNLVAKAKGPAVRSGLLILAIRIFRRIATSAGLPLQEVVDYVTGQDIAWDYPSTPIAITTEQWDRDIASLDASIFALLDPEIESTDIETALTTSLQGSLFSRQLARRNEQVQSLIGKFVVARAHRIWSNTTPSQRKGFYAAGIGLLAGKFFDLHLTALMRLMLQSEVAVIENNANQAVESITGIAKLVFQIAPFRPPGPLVDRWEDALGAWLNGQRASEVVRMVGDDGVDILQDAFSYRLPWAMEAIRVHAVATGHENADMLQGYAAMAVEVGHVNVSVILLLRAGLNSREAAVNAITTTGGSFDSRSGLLAWLRSPEIAEITQRSDWPTPQTHHTWVQFLEREKLGSQLKWTRAVQPLEVTWSVAAPPANSAVVVEPNLGGTGGSIFTPDLVRIGAYTQPLERNRRYISSARVSNSQAGVNVEFFAPVS